MAGVFESHYEGSDECSENELLERSLSVWKGEWRVENEPDFSPIPLDLHTASSIGQYECVRNIIQKGETNLEKKNIGGWTAIMYAAYIGHDTVVNLLLDAGVRVNVRNNKGHSPLMLAASCGNESVTFFLIQAAAEIEARDKKGWTALFHATYSGHQNMVTFLLNNGANANALEPSRELTPFMMAAAAGHEIIVQCFLRHGVEVNAKALSGDTACSLALINGHTKIVGLIENHMRSNLFTTDSALSFDGDLSSSDENFQNPRRYPRGRGRGSKGSLNIKDGPEAFAKMLKAKKPTAQPFQANFRDVTSPINQDDQESSSSNLDSSGGKDSSNEVEDDTSAFSKTGALTIKSSSSSSGGLIAALGLSREGSVGDVDVDQRSVCSDPGVGGGGTFSQSWSTGQKASSRNPWQNQSGAESLFHPTTPQQQQGLDILRGAEQLQTLEQMHQAQNRHAEELTRQRIAEAFNLEAIPPFQPPQPQQSTLSPQQNIVPHPRQAAVNRPTGQEYAPPKEKVVRQVAEVTAMHHPAGQPPQQPLQQQRSPLLQRQQQSQQQQHSPQLQRQQQQPAKRKDEVVRIEEDGDELAAFLQELGLAKYIPVFSEQEVNLQVFLSLTDNDLKEIGIKLFGPRRKMTNAIARWHSQANVVAGRGGGGSGAARDPLEQAYADKLEAEMQELAIQLHQASERCEGLQQQLAQEKELRAVTEGYLLDDRTAWQHVQVIAADTRSQCSLLQHTLNSIGQYHDELTRRFGSSDSPFSRSGGSLGQDSLTAALRERLLLLDDKASGSQLHSSPSQTDLTKLPTQQLIKRAQKLHDEATAMLGAVTVNADRLLGQDVDYSGVASGGAGDATFS